jgi:hypothetical protein
MLYQLSYRISFALTETNAIFVKCPAKIKLHFLMSNYRLAFFTFMVFALQMPLSFAQLQSNNSLRQKLLRAEVAYERQDLSTARKLYHQLFDAGFFTEESLLRLAEAYEADGQWIESLYFLQKADRSYGKPGMSFHLRQLEAKLDPPVRAHPDSLPAYESWLHQHVWLLRIVQALFFFLAAFFLLTQKKSWFFSVGLIFLFCSLITGTGSLLGDHALPERAMLMQATPFYQQAGYAADPLSLPMVPGQVLEVKEEHDIWCKIAYGRYAAWVPQMYVRKL